VARLLGENGNTGQLNISNLAIGMILFTAVMGIDILTFGLKMRKKSVGPKNIPIWDDIFALPGRFVLLAILLLIISGWLLVLRT
jgi:hypothetical protein